MRPELIPGINVDRVDIKAGLAQAAELGYNYATDRMIIKYVLQRQRRGEEEGARRTWLSYYPRDLTSFTIIIAHAISADPAIARETATTIASVIRASAWHTNNAKDTGSRAKSEVAACARAFGRARTVAALNRALTALYDLADADRV